MTGTIINAGAILAGGITGLAIAKDLQPRTQYRIKMILGVLVIYAGLSTTWKALGGGFFVFLKQILIVLLSLSFGNLLGRALRLQDRLNSLGQFAKQTFARREAGGAEKFSEGFVTCTLLFCVGPMAIIGSLQDGLSGNYRVLALKALMDGLASMAFAKTFGWSVLLSAVPVLAYQGAITLGARVLEPMFQQPGLVDAMNATGGLLVVCIAVVILEVQKVPLANYLPSLVLAPLLALWWGF